MERIKRNPRLDPVYWDKELRKEMAKARPDQRDAFVNNVERCVARAGRDSVRRSRSGVDLMSEAELIEKLVAAVELARRLMEERP